MLGQTEWKQLWFYIHPAQVAGKAQATYADIEPVTVDLPAPVAAGRPAAGKARTKAPTKAKEKTGAAKKP